MMLGVMWTSLAGAHKLVASMPISLAASVAPLGWKTLFDCRPDFANGSVDVPMLEDVAPLSTTADEIDPSSMPRRSYSSSLRYVCWELSVLIAASDSVAHR